MNLYRLNLNLLPGLKALLDTQSVSKAAKQMHVTQSAMSRTLAQLRESLNDPILVRQGNKIFLSEKAISLKEDVNRVVTEACTIFENQQFDPSTTEKHFSIASTYLILDQMLPDILHQLWQQAPNFNFELLQFSPMLSRKLETGDVDLVIGYVGEPPAGFSSVPLIDDDICALVHKDHPCANKALKVSDLEKHPVIRHSAWTGSLHLIRTHLDSLSDNIRIAAKTPNLPISLRMLRHAEHILVTTRRATQSNIYENDLVMKELPGETPSLQYYVVWPEYWEHNRAHRWFREFIVDRIRQQMEEVMAETREAVAV